MKVLLSLAKRPVTKVHGIQETTAKMPDKCRLALWNYVALRVASLALVPLNAARMLAGAQTTPVYALTFDT
jgi:hypothetical protein